MDRKRINEHKLKQGIVLYIDSEKKKQSLRERKKRSFPSKYYAKIAIGTSLAQDDTFFKPSFYDQIESAKELYRSLMEISATHGEGEENMSQQLEELKNKIHEIDKKVAVIEERTKILDRIEAKLETLATRDFVESKVNGVETKISKTQLKHLYWLIGSAIAIAGVATTIIIGAINIIIK